MQSRIQVTSGLPTTGKKEMTGMSFLFRGALSLQTKIFSSHGSKEERGGYKKK